MIIQVCVGSSCHLKGSYDIVEMLRAAVENHGLAEEITLAGSFCIGKCDRAGVTVQVDEKIITSVTRDNFRDFFAEYVLKEIEKKRR